MAEQVGQTLDDGKAETEATHALASRIVELVELFEDRLNLLFGDADTGVPHLDAQFVAPAPAAEQDLASLSILDGIRKQITDHLLEQSAIARDSQTAGNHSPVEAARFRVIGKIGLQLLEHIVHSKIDPLGL
ncbi:MAG TPA: hypothetical protein VN044_09960, partial [Verrucomicrobiae bacterium]|nr:hypothetical protein [Verrucomicrobiae bacterium]